LNFLNTYVEKTVYDIAYIWLFIITGVFLVFSILLLAACASILLALLSVMVHTEMRNGDYRWDWESTPISRLGIGGRVGSVLLALSTRRPI